jgi:cytoskeletal protein CcmA (bactofilin family)
MFGRKPPTTVGAGTKLRGTIDGGSDDVQVDGQFEGSIQTDSDVTVTAGGAVLGDIRADSVTIGGRVDGTVVAHQQLRMLATGHLHGDAHYGTLEVERGGVIEGRATSDTDGAALPPVLQQAEETNGLRETTRQFAPPMSDELTDSDPPTSEGPVTLPSSPPSSPPSAPPQTKPSSPPVSAPPPPRLPRSTASYGAGSSPPPPPRRPLSAPKAASKPPPAARSEPPKRS